MGRFAENFRFNIMDQSIILQNLLSPPILFFFLGVLAVFVKSDLNLPQPLPKLFSLYLLLAIGFKGGVELNKSGFSYELLYALAASVLMALLVPFYSFFILKRKFNVYNAAAIAATYGSVSAVTFITGVNFLDISGAAYSGYMVAAMALMESPAIIIGVFLVQYFAPKNDKGVLRRMTTGELIGHSFTNGSVILILGSMIIGMVTGTEGAADLAPFTDMIFKGMLAFFLLDMGLLTANRIGALKRAGIFAILFSLAIPLINAVLGITISYFLGFSSGNALLFTILCASASYIAVPAAMRMNIPEADPGLYVPMSLAITFPFNIIVGIPLYYFVINMIWL
jgi:uncharacterized protein